MTLLLFAVASSPSSATCSRSCVRSRCCSTSRWAGIGGQRVTWPQYSSLIGRLTSILTSDWSPRLNTHLWLVASPQHSPLIGRLTSILLSDWSPQLNTHLWLVQGDEVKNRKKQRKVETEVADLRLKLATIQSRNIVLSNREIRLLRSVKRCHRYFAVIIISIHYVHFHGYVCSVKFRWQLCNYLASCVVFYMLSVRFLSFSR